MKVSIIIPVYNVEKYLPRCVQSVLDQTHKNLEIILVDDGSTDSSGGICDSFSEIDERIKVIHKLNDGASSARNAALDIITGETVAFVDADDYVANDYIETLVYIMETYDADVSVIAYKRTSEYVKGIFDSQIKENIKTYTGREACKSMFLSKKIDSSVCCKLTKRELISNRRFLTAITIGEDLEFFYNVFINARSVASSNKIGYAYVQHGSNTINSVTPKNIASLACMENLIVGICNKDLQEAAKSKFISTCFHFYLLTEDATIRNTLEAYIKRYRKDMFFALNVSTKVRLACIASCFGFDFLNTVFGR